MTDAVSLIDFPVVNEVSFQVELRSSTVTLADSSVRPDRAGMGLRGGSSA
jgi:hypothetical protein